MWISWNLKVHGIWSSKTRIIDINILGIECRWNSNGEFQYGGGRWNCEIQKPHMQSTKVEE